MDDRDLVDAQCPPTELTRDDALAVKSSHFKAPNFSWYPHRAWRVGVLTLWGDTGHRQDHGHPSLTKVSSANRTILSQPSVPTEFPRDIESPVKNFW